MINDYERFWEENRSSMSLGADAARVPVSVFLNGDWICDRWGADCPRYYSDYDYQHEARRRASEEAYREFGFTIEPDVDFGVIMDASIYGGGVRCEQKATPVLTPVINDPSEIKDFVTGMRSVDIMKAGLVPTYMDWRERVRRDSGKELRYGGSIKGCATTLGQLCGITNFLTWILTDPDEINMLVRCWLETSIRYLDTIREETGLKSFDGQRFSFASDVVGMLSPGMYRDSGMWEAEKQLYERYAGGPNDKRYYHADYHMLHLLPLLRESGVNEVNIDPYVTPAEILEKLPGCVIYGQVPPTKTLLYGTAEEVKECVKRDIEQAGSGRNLIICTAGSINPGTTFDMLRALCEAADEFGRIY